MNKIKYKKVDKKSIYTIKTPKNQWVKTNPKRYAYHLTYGGNLVEKENSLFYKRLSIISEGLHGKDQDLTGVWAHRAMLSLYEMYPFNIDCNSFFWGDPEGLLNYIYNYDVWQIDTWSFKANWYMDPNMIEVELIDQWDYLFTEESIPPHALQLFTIKVNDYAFLYEKNSKDYDLKPVKWINDLLYYKKRKTLYTRYYI